MDRIIIHEPRILVIHPKDSTTDFLSVIYENLECTVVTNSVSNSSLKELIKNHEHIIMLGHGDETCLFGFGRKVIDSQFVFLLKDKFCTAIWCHADKFIKKYDLHGFYTGMFVSEYDEALHYCLHQPNYDDIVQSNKVFAKAVSNHFSYNSEEMCKNVILEYRSLENNIVDYNIQNLYWR